VLEFSRMIHKLSPYGSRLVKVKVKIDSLHSAAYNEWPGALYNLGSGG